MAFQSSNVVAAGLGVPDGTDTHGPRLAEGIHLRWAVRREIGFPWHGFHLYRRRSAIGKPRQLTWQLSGEEPRDIGDRVYFVPDFGIGSSDRNIVVARQDGRIGFDLEGRSWLRWSLRETIAHRVTVHVALRGSTTAVEVGAYSHGLLIARDYASGQPDGTANVTFEFDTITEIVIRGGAATLYNVEIAPVADGAERGWKELQTFHYPLRLPLVHPAYPPPSGIASVDEAHDLAKKRVAGAGDFVDPAWVDFKELHEQLASLAEKVASGGRMVDTVFRVPDPDGAGEKADVEVAMLQRPLDLVLLSCLDPTIAQMVGLYWVDTTAEDREVYDYLMVADHGNPEGLVREAVLGEGTHPADIPNSDSFITFRHSLMDVQPLRPPRQVELYALSDAGAQAAAADKEHAAGRNRVGVRWDLGTLSGTALRPEQPAMFRLLRADLGETQPIDEPEADEFDPVTRAPIVVARPSDDSAATDRPNGWPDVRLLAVDAGLHDGWYSYRVAGVDLFGRQSPPSAPGRWWQWTPAPQPRPWYYQTPATNRVVHPYAVCLRDETPPPPPTGVEAQALDPAADQQWREELAAANEDSVVGVNVRWSWPARLARQAPDVVEFLVYYQVGMLNVLRGTVVGVTAGGAGERVVTTDIADDLSDDAYEGLSVRLGGRRYRIVGSESDGTLKLRVREGDEAPEAGAPCAIGLRPSHPRYTDYHEPTNWEAHFHTVPVGDYAREEIIAGEIVRHYEVRLPELDASPVDGLPIEATLTDPVVYAHLGVTAVRDDPEPVDLPDPGGGPPTVIDDFQTESPVGNPAPVYVVLREKPEPPAPPHVDGDELLATRADYHGQSYFTHRWKPSPHLRAHVYRALDDAVFRTDLRLRPRGHLDPGDQADEALFPDDWGADRIGHVASELNDLDDLLGDGIDGSEAEEAYRSLSNDAVRILAGLPGNERAFSQRTIDPLDPDDPATADRRGPDDPDDYEPDDGLRCYIDEIDGRSSSRFLYRTAYVDPAQNRSDLGLASPPVATPKVTPPRTPAVAKVVGGDREIQLLWPSNREYDLAEYRVYRADSEQPAGDLRLMPVVHVEDVGETAPPDRPRHVTFTDTDIVAYRQHWYRVCAVDTAGNVSKPSKAVQGQAFDHGTPQEAQWEQSEWVKLDPSGGEYPWDDDVPGAITAVALRFRVPQPYVSALVQHQDRSGAWHSLTSWQRPEETAAADGWEFAHHHVGVAADATHRYRTKLKNRAGVTLESQSIQVVAAPGSGGGA